MDDRMRGRRVLLIGAGPGAGRVIALLCAQEGARVALSARSAETLGETVEAVRAAGGQAWAVPGDATRLEEVQRVVKRSAQEMGGLDGLVHGVGGGFYDNDRRAHELSPEAWRDIVGRTLDSAYYAAHAALPHLMQAGGGSVVFLAASDRVRVQGSAAYAAAKAGVIELARKMAAEYRPANVRVNVVSPGMIRRGGAPLEAVRPVDEPLPRDGRERQGEAADVAFAALYLLSQEAAWVTGTEIVVDGGFNLRNRG